MKQVILYGSYARGDFSKDPDIDLLVYFSATWNLSTKNLLN
ncbi:MAG: nucleotidyltransferase family protein [Candidatus Jordarchaeum sp.]